MYIMFLNKLLLVNDTSNLYSAQVVPEVGRIHIPVEYTSLLGRITFLHVKACMGCSLRHAWHADPTEPGGLPYSYSLELDREEEEEEEDSRSRI